MSVIRRFHLAGPRLCLLALALVVAIANGAIRGQPFPGNILRIGGTSALTGDADSAKEKTGLKTLHRFIKEETGLDNEITGPQPWENLVTKMAEGTIHVGVFQGHEFAWAQEKHADLKPMALGINIRCYWSACVVGRRDTLANSFAGLQDRSLAIPVTSPPFVRLFIDREVEASHKKAPFFSRINSPDNAEDALDDVVDGKVQAAAVDQAALEAYKRRKPGRFNKLKELVRSQVFPPVVVAYYGSTLDEAMLRRFKDGLLGASRKEKGEMLLTLSRLSGFVNVPDDFRRVLADTLKAYPPMRKME
jgi:ABC-type phosphate/phosphonate transport system substrate-binding protein